MRTSFSWLLFFIFLLGFVQAQGWELRVCADPNNLPASDQKLQGFDNRIAALLAKELNAKLTYVWWPQGSSAIDYQLRQGNCDLVMGVGDGYKNVLSSLAYYQSSYVFVYRADSPYQIATLDDPILRKLRIAIETAGIPPFESLANRGLSKGVVIVDAFKAGGPLPSSPIVEAVAKNQVDVAILWGPVAGYFARKQGQKLRVVPIMPEFEPPALSMVYPITMGVRSGDDAFRDRLNIAIARRWDQIQAILQEYGLPQVPLPKPVLEVK